MIVGEEAVDGIKRVLVMEFTPTMLQELDSWITWKKTQCLLRGLSVRDETHIELDD